MIPYINAILNKFDGNKPCLYGLHIHALIAKSKPCRHRTNCNKIACTVNF
jgi:hypothetical protein